MNAEEVTPEEKACRESAHALRGDKLGQLCRPCAEDELIRLRSIVARLSKSALRIVKRPDGHWLFIEAGGLEAAIILRGPDLNPFSIVDRCIGAACIAEILPAPPYQPRIQSTPDMVAPPTLSGCPSCEAGLHGMKCVNAMCDCPCRRASELGREHIFNGPCWCGPLEAGKVFKHKLTAPDESQNIKKYLP